MSHMSCKSFLIAIAATGALACACNRSQTNSAPSASALGTAAENPEALVAKIGDTNVNMRELEESIGPQLRELTEQAYDIRRQGLDQIVNQRLVQKAAFKKGQTEEQYLQEAVEAKVSEPSDADVKHFFEQNSAQLPPGAKLADFKDRISQFLKRQSQAERAKEVFAELRKEGNVEILLQPPAKPRLQVAATGPSRGPADAKVTIVEFSDFECPFCSRAKTVADEAMKKYDGKVRLVFRQFPLSFHAHAKKAAEASLCANAQNKFWEYHDALFAEQSKLDVPSLKQQAEKLGLDKEAFNKCLDEGAMAKTVADDMADAQKVGVTGTPAFFINGIMLSGAQPIDEFSKVIDAELSGQK